MNYVDGLWEWIKNRLRNSTDRTLISTTKVVIGSAYGALLYDVATGENGVFAILLGATLFLLPWGLYKLLNFLEAPEEGDQNEGEQQNSRDEFHESPGVAYLRQRRMLR